MPAIIGCCWRRAICRNGCLAVCSGGSPGCRFRRDSRGCGSREIDPDQQRREGCLTKPDGKAVVSSLGTRVGADGTLVPSPGPSQRKNSALDSLAGYIVWGCWELKRKFRLNGVMSFKFRVSSFKRAGITGFYCRRAFSRTDPEGMLIPAVRRELGSGFVPH